MIKQLDITSMLDTQHTPLVTGGQIIVQSTGRIVAQTIQLGDGEVQLQGGVLAVGSLNTVLGTVRGNGGIVATNIDNQGLIKAEGGTLTIDGQAGFQFRFGSQTTGQIQAFTGDLVLDGSNFGQFNGTAVANAGHAIRTTGDWLFANQGSLHFPDAGSLAEFATDNNSDVTVTGKGTLELGQGANATRHRKNDHPPGRQRSRRQRCHPLAQWSDDLHRHPDHRPRNGQRRRRPFGRK